MDSGTTTVQSSAPLLAAEQSLMFPNGTQAATGGQNFAQQGGGKQATGQATQGNNSQYLGLLSKLLGQQQPQGQLIGAPRLASSVSTPLEFGAKPSATQTTPGERLLYIMRSLG